MPYLFFGLIYQLQVGTGRQRLPDGESESCLMKRISAPTFNFNFVFCHAQEQ